MQNKEDKIVKNEKDTLLTILIAVGITTLIFIIAMTIIFCVKDAVPDTLISSYFTAVFSEAGFCAIIQVFKILKKQKEKTEEEETVDDEPEGLSFADIISKIKRNDDEEADG